VLLMRPDAGQIAHVQQLVEDFVVQTNSRYAAQILTDWAQVQAQFWRVWPRELEARQLNHQDQPLNAVA
jgi:glutamate synthase domain-containing protein 3